MNSALSPVEQAEIDAFLNTGINLPPQPKVLMEIDAILAKPNASLRGVAELVAKDAALTARIFKIIHSPFFALGREIDSLDQAIAILGHQATLTVIKGAALRQAIGGDLPAIDAFWERANDIAALCRLIAKKQRSILRVSLEHTHMAGLFHDCGVPILMQRFPGYCSTLAQGWPDLVEEDAKVKSSHAVAGYLVARNWKLPAAVCQCVRHHHELGSLSAEDHTLTAILLMATHLYDLVFGKESGDWEAHSATVLAEIGLTPATQVEFQEEIIQSFQEAQY
jgi:HD-like signal output (HDOD) protein